ncbi:endonuclease V [Photobacterium japonica]|uniref:endonuclease V n=1 Tax=Photobacterium japonica TaxID=2910235 RepID=UPI003D0D6168
MHVIIDVDYRTKKDDGVAVGCDWAVVAGLTFQDWQSDVISETYIKVLDEVAPYEPGQFYKRELPCLLALIAKMPFTPSCIIIDGYVTLGEEKRDGLGAYLYRALGEKIPVIGIAKNRFADTPAACEVLRGKSQNPVFVTCMGMALEAATHRVQTMHGAYRLPTLAKAVDSECRQAERHQG